MVSGASGGGSKIALCGRWLSAIVHWRAWMFNDQP
jgi:hypothetical protein